MSKQLDYYAYVLSYPFLILHKRKYCGENQELIHECKSNLYLSRQLHPNDVVEVHVV